MARLGVGSNGQALGTTRNRTRDKVDTAEADEVIDAIAKTVAKMTSQQGGVIRQQLIEYLTRDNALRRRVRREQSTSAVGYVRH